MNEVLDLFRKTGALLHGHFVLRSGLHSREFFQCALLLQDATIAAQVCGMLAEKLKPFEATTVVSPAVGGIIVGQEVARQLGVRFIFVEKENDKLVLRRNFTFRPGERVLVAEDVVTRGGRVQECLEIIRAHGAQAVAVATLVDRSGGQTKFSVPFVSLLELTFPTYAADQVPPALAALPATKPGS